MAALLLIPVWPNLRATAAAPGAAFTYEGQLRFGGNPVTGVADFRFTLFPSELGGAPVATPVDRPGIALTGGVFVATLDFGAEAFNGDPRWIEIAVRRAPENEFTRLAPRQPVGAVPYSLHAVSGGIGQQGPPGPAGPPGAKGDPGTTWAGIADKPPGFADGIDHDTVRGAGPGLKLEPTFGGGTNFAVQFLGSGIQSAAARADHVHWGDTWFASDGSSSRIKFDQESAILVAAQNSQGAANHGVIGRSRGQATGVTGSSEAGNGLAGQSESGNGVVGGSTTGTGVLGVNGFKRGRLGTDEAAVVADAGTSTATAIQVEKGAFRVKGAGLNANTFVFVHPVTEANYTAINSGPEITEIDHPMCNGDPDAILIVTPRYTPRLVGGATSFAVWYTSGRWKIRADPMDPGDRFNVMVIKP